MVTRIAVIGGGIRGRVFADVVRRHPGAELAGMCDLDQGRRDSLAREFDVPGARTLEELMHIAPVDATIVATPDFAHREPVLAALDAGLDVLVEKPLATRDRDAEEIARLARESGRRLMVGFENRWNPLVAAVRSEVRDAGAKLVSQRALLQDTIFVPREMLSWADGSSPGWFLMPHSLDLAMWISGACPTEVFARGVRSVLASSGTKTWDRISASFAMSDGSILDLDSGWVQPLGKPNVFEFRFEIETAQGAWVLDIDDTGARRFDAERMDTVAAPPVDHRGRPRGPQADMTVDFIDALLGEDLALPGPDEGLVVTRAISAVHESLETGQPIAIPSGGVS